MVSVCIIITSNHTISRMLEPMFHVSLINIDEIVNMSNSESSLPPKNIKSLKNIVLDYQCSFLHLAILLRYEETSEENAGVEENAEVDEHANYDDDVPELLIPNANEDYQTPFQERMQYILTKIVAPLRFYGKKHSLLNNIIR